MKTTTFVKAFVAAFVFVTACSTSLFAQLKVGNNPTTIGASNNLEVEATNGNKTVISKGTGAVSINGAITIESNLSLAGADDYTLKIDASGNVKKAPTETSVINPGSPQLIGTLGPNRNMYRKCFFETSLPSVLSSGTYSFTNVIPIGNQSGVPRTKVSNVYGTIAELNVATAQYRFFPMGWQASGAVAQANAIVDEFGTVIISWTGFTGFGGGIKEIVQVCVEYGVAKNQDSNNGNP